MKYYPTGAQMRSADLFTIEKIGIPSLVLMERAALECVRLMESENLDFSKVLILCGAGNNGGDGYAVARLLHLKGHSVDIFFVGKEETRSEENRKQKEIAEYYAISTVKEIEDNYTLIIDAVFGTGLKRNVEGMYAEAIEKANMLSAIRVAIDVPSGVHDETGEIMGTAFQADYTMAIAFAKRGLLFFPGASYAGKILIGDIGITEQAIPKEDNLTFGYDESDLKQLYPKRISNSHKGTYGKVLLIVGSKGMSGAAYLCARAAYVVGAGLVQIYTHEENRMILQQLLPEAIISTYHEYDEQRLETLLAWADVIGIGCGLGMSETAKQLVSYVMKYANKKCVVDADALNIIATLPEIDMQAECIFTPHMKEMSRLTGIEVSKIAKNRVQVLQNYIKNKKLTVVMKDARTLVSDGGNQIYVNTSGNSAMAKGGSGDVLTGMIAGIFAQGKNPFEVACLAVYLHGLAGDLARNHLGKYSVLASDIINSIGTILKEI